MNRNVIWAIAFMVLASFAVPQASAAVFDLNKDYCTGLCFPAGGTGGTVTITDLGSDVSFDVELTTTTTATTVPLNFHDSNAFMAFVFNCVGAVCGTAGNALSTTSISSNFALAVPPNSTNPEDGAGHSWTAGIDFTGTAGSGGNTGVHSLLFTIHSTLGALDLSNFEQLNGNNVDFSASVTTINTSGTNCTGVIGGGNGADQSTSLGTGTSVCASNTSVPEPTSVLLFGTMLAIVGKVLKRRLAV